MNQTVLDDGTTTQDTTGQERSANPAGVTRFGSRQAAWAARGRANPAAMISKSFATEVWACCTK